MVGGKSVAGEVDYIVFVCLEFVVVKDYAGRSVDGIVLVQEVNGNVVL